MKLRKFLIFFVLVFYLFSTNVYSSSIFGVEVINHIPDDLRNYGYIIAYSHYSKQIYLCVNQSSLSIGSFHLFEDGVYDENGNKLKLSFRRYDFDSNTWKYYYLHDDDVSWSIDGINENSLKPYYSNKDVYFNDEIYVFGKEHFDNLGVFSGISANVFFVSLLKPFLKLMPFILAFIVLFFTFFKMWKFIKGVF